MDEAALARKLHDEVFSREANERLATAEETEEPAEEQPDEQEEPAQEEQSPEDEVEVSADGEPAADDEEERPAREEPVEPADEEEEEQATDEFYAARYRNREETERGLREQANTIGRQSHEIGQLRAQLEEQAQQINALSERVQSRPGGMFAPSFDLSTVEQALASLEENEWGPAEHIERALSEQGDIGLAYAICDAWEEHNPLGARYARRGVDVVAERSQGYEEPEPEPTQQPVSEESVGQALAMLASEVPDLHEYQEMMSRVVDDLPAGHWIEVDLERGDERARMRALYTIYERAKDRSLGIASAREQIKKDQKQEGASARKRAAVASGQASAGGSDTPKNNTARFLQNMRSNLRQQGQYAADQ